MEWTHNFSLITIFLLILILIKKNVYSWKIIR